MSERILLAIDATSASDKAVEYVARMVQGAAGHHVHVVHVIEPAPSHVMEAIGPEGSAHGERTRASEHWDAQERAAARGLVTGVRERLLAAGVAEDHVDSGTLSADQRCSLADGLLDLARDQECGTIVVGRNSLPWYRELAHRHPADELVHKAAGYTVWIVE
jgi:nucleotide-binding universal stress UspA family protein